MTQLSVPRYISVATFQAISSPTDGDLVTIQADVVNGVNWVARYNSSSASLYKWESVSSSPYTSIVATEQSNGAASNSTWFDVTTAGPNITVPLTGDYYVHTHAQMWGGGGGIVKIAPKVGAAAVANIDAAGVSLDVGNGTGSTTTITRSFMLRTLTAGTVLKLQYWAGNNASNTRFLERQISLQPVRLSST